MSKVKHIVKSKLVQRTSPLEEGWCSSIWSPTSKCLSGEHTWWLPSILKLLSVAVTDLLGSHFSYLLLTCNYPHVGWSSPASCASSPWRISWLHEPMIDRKLFPNLVGVSPFRKDSSRIWTPKSNTLVWCFVGPSKPCIMHSQEHHVYLEPWSISLCIHFTSHSSLFINIHFKSFKGSVLIWISLRRILVCRRAFWVHYFFFMDPTSL